MAYCGLLLARRANEFSITNNVLIMNDIQNTSNQNTSNNGLLQKGIDIMKDPTSSTESKAGAIGIVAIAAIALVAKSALAVIGKH